MDDKITSNTTVRPRPITREFLDELVEWTWMAPMFLGSPEGRVFGEKMREVIGLARMALEERRDVYR